MSKTMKLWIIRPIDSSTGPWDPWYDKCFGCVIAAETEEQARTLVEPGDEVRCHIRLQRHSGKDTLNTWLDPSLSTCVELEPGTEPRCIMQDFHQA